MIALLRSAEIRLGVLVGASGMLLLALSMGIGYWCGRSASPGFTQLDLKRVSTAASGTNMAVATGSVSDEAEGVFFLDFLTGDLQCLVYYPRSGAFGARYYTNIQAQLPATGKSGQYLMVTGAAITSRTSSNMRPGNCLVYITDVSSGNFAAYTVPWSKTAENSSQAQLGTLVYVGGGPIRNYQISNDAGQPKKPAAAPAAAPPVKVMKDPKPPKDAKDAKAANNNNDANDADDPAAKKRKR